MKKLILSICIATIGMGAFAQRHKASKSHKFNTDKLAVGVNLNYATDVSNVGLGVKGQYKFTRHWRGELTFNHYFEKNNWSSWDLTANVHYLFPLQHNFTVYPLAGLGIVQWNYSFKDIDKKAGITSASTSRLGINLGGGVQYDINRHWAVNFEAKYQFVSDFNQGIIGFGAIYKF